jgi:hypothetical protein
MKAFLANHSVNTRRILFIPVIIAIILSAGGPVTFAGNHPSTLDGSERRDPLKLPLAQVGDCDGTDGIYLYEQPDYKGDCRRFTGDVSNLAAVGFDNVASSLEFRGSYRPWRYRVPCTTSRALLVTFVAPFSLEMTTTSVL